MYSLLEHWRGCEKNCNECIPRGFLCTEPPPVCRAFGCAEVVVLELQHYL